MAKGLPKNIISKYGITKKAWQVFRSKHPYKKTYKGGTSKVKTVKKTMARKRRYIRKRGYRRKKDKRISLIGTAGAIGSIFVPRDGQMSMGQWLMEWANGTRQFGQGEDINHFLADTVGQYTGFDWREGAVKWKIPWATVTIMTTGIASKVANKFGGRYLRNVPLIGKYVKF